MKLAELNKAKLVSGEFELPEGEKLPITVDATVLTLANMDAINGEIDKRIKGSSDTGLSMEVAQLHGLAEMLSRSIVEWGIEDAKPTVDVFRTMPVGRLSDLFNFAVELAAPKKTT